MKSSKAILVIGANGKTGSRVMNQLSEQGYQVKGASRNGEVKFDWDDATTWAAALKGIDAVYVTYFPDLAIPKAPGDIAKFCELAEQSGTQHITLLSGRGEPAAQVCEDIVKQSKLSWTIVRASWFNQNFSEGLFRDFIMSGKMALPVSVTTEPFVDVDDIADVVVASLTDSRHAGELYEVTGPELLSFAELANKFSMLTNHTVHFEQISVKEFQNSMRAEQVSEPEIEMLTYLFSEVLDGRNEFIADGVYRALGRQPRNFNQFILNNLKAFSEAA